MRRSIAVLRGAKGRGWYYQFQAEGQKSFTQKYKPPPAFDWSFDNQGSNRPIAYFDVAAEGSIMGRMKFELASDVVPETVNNFISLINGSGSKGYKYDNTSLYRIVKNVAIMGGDVENGDGSGNHSSLSKRYIKDENFIIPHSERGLISMTSVGIDTGGSQFIIALNATPHLNGRGVVFGRMIEGESILKQIEAIFTFRGAPAKKLTIKEAGILDDDNIAQEA